MQQITDEIEARPGQADDDGYESDNNDIVSFGSATAYLRERVTVS
jgi:hypothetical protein